MLGRIFRLLKVAIIICCRSLCSGYENALEIYSLIFYAHHVIGLEDWGRLFLFSELIKYRKNLAGYFDAAASLCLPHPSPSTSPESEGELSRPNPHPRQRQPAEKEDRHRWDVGARENTEQVFSSPRLPSHLCLSSFSAGVYIYLTVSFIFLANPFLAYT